MIKPHRLITPILLAVIISSISASAQTSLARFGEAIYGTRGGPLAPADWGVTTQKGDKVHVHVLSWNVPLLALPPIPRAIRAAQLLAHGSAVEFTPNSNGVGLKIAPAAKGEVDRIVVLAFAGDK